MINTRLLCCLLVAFLLSAHAFSQTMRVWVDGEMTEYRTEEVDSIIFIPESVDSAVHECVDLGLPSGLQWASRNIGAAAPENSGNYYAWGEKENKESYENMNYEFFKAKNSTCSNLGNLSSTENDVAAQTWGDGWRMPTSTEMRELVESCTWVWTEKNGVQGMTVTGPNGRSIFLPAAGYYRGSVLYAGGEMGCYWTSNQRGYHTVYNAWCLYFDLDGQYKWDTYYRRCDGHPVRPVRSSASIQESK